MQEGRKTTKERGENVKQFVNCEGEDGGANEAKEPILARVHSRGMEKK